MSDSFRDDAPAQFRLSRRQILVGGGLIAGGLTAGLPLPKLLASAAPVANPTSVSPFMRISSLLIQHHLDASVGQRLAVAMKIQNPKLPDEITELLAIALQKNAATVEDFFPDVPEGPLKQTALAIISAWYVGVVVDAPGAEVFAFELALLFQPTIDVMTIPTYAVAGPNHWTAAAPPLSDLPKF